MVVETPSEFEYLRKITVDTRVLVIPVLSDNSKHYTRNSITAYYVYLIEDEIGFIVPVNHSEALNQENTLNYLDKATHVFIYKRKFVDTELECVDLELICNYYARGVSDIIDYFTNAHVHIHRAFYDIAEINRYVPLLKHKEWCERFIKSLDLEFLKTVNITSKYEALDRDIQDSFFRLEQTGIKVNVAEFHKEFPRYKSITEEGLVFTEYNPYTRTMRPSSRYQGVNFAALPKAGNTRELIISRFGEDGIIVSIDYSSYHMYLLAKIMGYEFKERDVHTYFAKQYFPNEEITEELRDRAKTLSFQNLYQEKHSGNVPNFFKHVYKLGDMLYETRKITGNVLSYVYGRPFYVEAKNMLLNYYIQNLETERNIYILKSVLDLLENYQSKCILYIYDSFVFDIKKSEISIVYPKLKELLELGNFPTATEAGPNYGNLKKIK